MPEQRLDTLARRVVDCREKYDAARKAKTKAEEAKNDAESALAAALKSAKQNSSGWLDLGPLGEWNFVPRSTIRARVIDRATAIKALGEDGMSEGYTVTELRKAPLTELVKTRLENGEDLPDGVDYSETKYVQATKKKK